MKDLISKKFQSNPYLSEIAKEGLLNIQALALNLVPEVSEAKGKSINATAIGMSIRRYLKTLSKQELANWEFPKDIEISLRSEIYEVAIERTSEDLQLFKQLQKSNNQNKGDFISILEGNYEIVILTNQKNKKNIKQLISASKVTSEVDNLGYITVNWEKLTKDIPGIYYRITKELAINQISIQSFHTIGAEMMILFKETELAKAYQVIQKLFK